MSFHVHTTKVRDPQTVYTKTIAVEISAGPNFSVRFERNKHGDINVTISNDTTRAEEGLSLTPEETETFVTAMASLVPNHE